MRGSHYQVKVIGHDAVRKKRHGHSCLSDLKRVDKRLIVRWRVEKASTPDGPIEDVEVCGTGDLRPARHAQ